MKIQVSIYRYKQNQSGKPKYQVFALPFSKGMTVLDVILFVQKNLDPTLGFRFECRQGVCGTCGVMYNGRPVLSCTTQIDNRKKKHTLAPLANFPVEKDLIVDLKPILSRFLEIKPYLEEIRKVSITRAQAEASKPFRKCIECGCCIAGSVTIGKKADILDPMDLVKIARYVTDPRDGLDRKKIAKEGGVEYYSEKEGKALAKICPRGVPIDEAIRLLKE